MRTIRRARGLAAALLLSIAGTSCRDSAAPSGLGRVAPTRAALAFASVLPESSGEPVIPLRSARVRLFRLPGEVPERAVVDTVVPFSETDADVTLTLGIVLTMVSERFGFELSLIDDQQQVVYRGRDTVVAYTSGPAPAAAPVALRYVGADTAVARIELAASEPVISIGEPLPLRATAFLRDGQPSPARFGFAVHGTSAITVDGTGVLRATAPVARGSAWIVARIATGLADSIAVEAIVPTASLSLDAKTARLDVGDRLTLGAVARDAAGAVLPGRRPLWSSSNESVATVVEGVVTARALGTALITARSGRASAEAAITVGPAKVARVVPSVSSLSIVEGASASVSVRAEDADGVALSGRAVTWSISDPRIASVSSSAAGDATVRGLTAGTTSLMADVEGVRATIAVAVRFAPAERVLIVPHGLALLEGTASTLTANVFDGAGAPQQDRVVAWRSLDPTIASVDGTGLVRALAGGRAAIVAQVDGVADTISVLSRRRTTLTITRTGTTFDSRGEIADFLVSSFDQFGVLIDNPSAQWSVTQGATLVSGSGPRTQLVLRENAKVVLSASAHGLAADLPVAAARVTAPATPPASPVTPASPTPPPTPPTRG
jgi:uncharacterized protein YjdB